VEKEVVSKLVLLRLVVGYLGEKPQFNWWPSNFLNVSTLKMFEFTFPRTAKLAHYEALSVAAARIHDGSIGIGKSFHLFRLPEFIEKSLISSIQSSNPEDISSKEDALNLLSEIAGTASLSGEGPLNLGQISGNQWSNFLSQIAAAYLQAFNSDLKVFPYFQNEQ
jgi:hypothetical protein